MFSSYLAHKRYKALLDGNGTEYNYIIHCEEQQKLGLEGLSDDEDDAKEEDDDDEDEEEEGDSDDGGPSDKTSMMEAYHMLSDSRSQCGLSDEQAGPYVALKRQYFSDASKETRTSVVALLSEVAGISQEKIATFAKVPHTMEQLTEKYELLRRAEIALHQQRRNQLKSFRQGEVIELDDIEDDGGGGDSVVVLDSDEEDDSTKEEKFQKGKKSVEVTKDFTKKWSDDDDDDGDEDCSNTAGLNMKDTAKVKDSEVAKDIPKEWSEYDDGDEDCWGSANVSIKDTTKDMDSLSANDKGKTTNANGQEENKIKSSKLEKVATTSDENVKTSSAKDSEGCEHTSKDGKTTSGVLLDKENASLVDKSKCSESDVQDSSKRLSDASPDILGKDMVEPDPSKGSVEDGNDNEAERLSKQVESVDHDHAEAEVPRKAQDKQGSKVSSSSKDEGTSNCDVESKEARIIVTGGSGCLSVDFNSHAGKEESSKAEQSASEDSSDSSSDSGKNDDDASNDSDDVICIESESATPSSVHNLLSQPRNTVVTKAVTFMSNITSQPSYVTAKVGFNSWDSLVHFNYSGDSTHLPTVMSAESQSVASTRSSSSKEVNGGSDATKQVYERLFPPVSTLLPSSKSVGAVIKQRLKGLPCLTSAYLKLNVLQNPALAASSHFSSARASNSTGNNSDCIISDSQSVTQSYQRQQHQTVKRKFQQSTPQSSHIAAEKDITVLSDTFSPIASNGSHPLNSKVIDTSITSETNYPIIVDSCLDSSKTPAKTSTCRPLCAIEVVMKYLKVFKEVSDSVAELHNGNETLKASTDTGNTKESSLLSLSGLVQQLRHLHTNSNSSLPDSPEAVNLLNQFHTQLSQYLHDIGVSSDSECELLQSLVSGTTSPTSSSNKEIEDTVKDLTDFQIKLLEVRLKHLKRNIDGDSVLECESPCQGNFTKKRKNSDTETLNAKRLKSDSEDGSKLKSKPMEGISCDSEINELDKSISYSTIGSSDASLVTMTSTPLNGGSSSEPRTEEVTGNNETKNGKNEQENVLGRSKDDSLNRSSSHKQEENSSLEGITIENSTMENSSNKLSSTSISSLEKYMSESSSEGAKLAEEKEQRKLNAGNVDQICIDSSSEEEIDDSDSESDESVEISSGPTLNARALCKSDDPDGELFVINNTSEEEELEDTMEEGEAEAIRNAHRWKPCVKEDPYPAQERLHLMLEEVRS